MASSTNPRRTPAAAGLDGLCFKSSATLRKGASFHSSSSSSNNNSSPSLPRAQSSLDDVVDAHHRRLALTLDSIGKTLANTHISSPRSPSSSALDSFLHDHDHDSHQLPRGLLSHAVAMSADASSSSSTSSERRVLQPRAVNTRRAHQHASDSGLGSSVSSTSGKHQKKATTGAAPAAAATTTKTTKTKRSKGTAVTRSAAAPVQASLSPRATNRIYEHTVKPLLAKPDFKVFHPLLLECTSKINKRDIVCLRDLEKTILLLAPERTKVAQLYLDFCLASVRCLQTTVEYLNDREATRPSDPPYTAGYFIDLVDQIHYYAQQLADAKEKKSVDTMGYVEAIPESLTLPRLCPNLSSSQIKLHGGIAVNGRPAELVSVDRDGRAVSIATGLPVELEEDYKDSVRVKRSASQEIEDEEEIMRSMARRKKNAPPEEYAPKMCSVPGCTKMFKRPCDLSKHEKTHSRPWKCPIVGCKYYEYGWPTEKEKDRHLNDKHSDNPPMYECLFKPCTYKSKRDSNRKQHMEKTHGWTYVRTKTNRSSKTKKETETGTATGDNVKKEPSASVSGSVAATPSVTSATPMMPTTTSPGGTSPFEQTPQLVNLPTPPSAHSPAVATPPLDEFSGPLFATTSNNAIEFPTCAPADILATDMDLPANIDDLDFSPLDQMDQMDQMDSIEQMDPMDPMDSIEQLDALDNASPSTVSSLDNNSAYQDLGPDAVIFDDIYAANVQLPTPQPNVYSKTLLDQFMAISAPDLCAPMVTPQQRLQLQRLQEMHQQLQVQKQFGQVQQQQQQPVQQQRLPTPQEQPQVQPLQSLSYESLQSLQTQPLQTQTQPLQVQPLQSVPLAYPNLAQISPLGEANMMLYTPETLVDEGYSDYSDDQTTVHSGKGDDFVLFPGASLMPKMGTFDNALFDEIPSVAAGYSQPNSQIFPEMNW